MTTAFVSLYLSYPPLCGAAVVSYQIARHLSGEKYLVQLGEKGGRERREDGLTIVTIGRGKETRWRKMAGMVAHVFQIAREINKIKPRTVVLEGASWTFYYLLVVAFLRRVGSKARLVYHAHNVEYDLRRQKNAAVIALLTRWAERRLVRRADAVYGVSEVDAGRMEILYGRRPRLLANGVDTEAYDQVIPAQVLAVRKKYGLPDSSVLFMGLPAYKPNADALDFLLKEVFPRLVSMRPKARLVVIGGEVAQKRPWLLNPGLIDFEEVPAFVRGCAAGVAPIFSGSGTRLKILEYMAAGIPVLATQKGAEGLDARDGEDILLRDDTAGFTETLARLLSDPPFAAKIGEGGRKLVARAYAWPVVIRAFQEDLDGI